MTARETSLQIKYQDIYFGFALTKHDWIAGTCTDTREPEFLDIRQKVILYLTYKSNRIYWNFVIKFKFYK